jgi:hypothetical protein
MYTGIASLMAMQEKEKRTNYLSNTSLNKCKCYNTRAFYLCKEEYDKCPKCDADGNPVHGWYKNCGLCAKTVTHYHCNTCCKMVDNTIDMKTNQGICIFHQGKKCSDYIPLATVKTSRGMVSLSIMDDEDGSY